MAGGSRADFLWFVCDKTSFQAFEDQDHGSKLHLEFLKVLHPRQKPLAILLHEGASKFVDNDWWTVCDKKGLQEQFGDVGNTKETAIKVTFYSEIVPKLALPEPLVNAQNFIAAYNKDPSGVVQKLSQEEKAFYAEQLCKAGHSPRSEQVLSLLTGMLENYMPEALAYSDHLRTSNITDDVIPSIGDRMMIVDRDEVTISMMLALRDVYKKQKNINFSSSPADLTSDKLKELPSFVAFLSIPGGGKTTAASELLPKALMSEPGSLSAELRAATDALEPDLRDALRVACTKGMVRRYDLSLPGNGFMADVQYSIPASASLALRLLYVLLGSCVPGEEAASGTFRDFIAWAARQPCAELLLRHSTPRMVQDLVRKIWEKQDDPRKSGAILLLLDEAHTAFEDGGAARFQDMLTSHGASFCKKASQPLLLVVAGTHLNITLAGKLRSGSENCWPVVLPLSLLSRMGCLISMKNLLQRLGGDPATCNESLLEMLAVLSGGCPRILECLLAAAARVLGGNQPGLLNTSPAATAESGVGASQAATSQADATQAALQDSSDDLNRFDIPAACLRQVLQGSTPFTTKMLEQTSKAAVLLLMKRCKGLEKYFTAEYKGLRQAIMKRQMMHGTVKREDVVTQDQPHITWSTLEGVGLVALVSTRKREMDAATALCVPCMPYLLYAYWTDQLLGRFEMIQAGIEPLADTSFSLFSRAKELLDLGQLVACMYVHNVWEGRKTIALQELLPVPEDLGVTAFCEGCHLKLPETFIIHTNHHQSSDEAVRRLINSKPLHRAFIGPGTASEPDWWLILDVDRDSSSGSWKAVDTLVIQGQSKLLQHATQSTLPLHAVQTEYEKRFKGLPHGSKSLFVLVTDQPVDNRATGMKDVLLIGKEECSRFYGAAGSLKREMIRIAWDREIKASSGDRAPSRRKTR